MSFSRAGSVCTALDCKEHKEVEASAKEDVFRIPGSDFGALQPAAWAPEISVAEPRPEVVISCTISLTSPDCVPSVLVGSRKVNR